MTITYTPAQQRLLDTLRAHHEISTYEAAQQGIHPNTWNARALNGLVRIEREEITYLGEDHAPVSPCHRLGYGGHWAKHSCGSVAPGGSEGEATELRDIHLGICNR